MGRGEAAEKLSPEEDPRTSTKGGLPCAGISPHTTMRQGVDQPCGIRGSWGIYNPKHVAAIALAWGNSAPASGGGGGGGGGGPRRQEGAGAGSTRGAGRLRSDLCLANLCRWGGHKSTTENARSYNCAVYLLLLLQLSYSCHQYVVTHNGN